MTYILITIISLISLINGDQLCNTEASSASECFALGCCWNGFNGCGDCDKLCDITSTPCADTGCCPTVNAKGILGKSCQPPVFLSKFGPNCCEAEHGMCSKQSLATGLCCDCMINGFYTCGTQFDIPELKASTLNCADFCLNDATTSPSISPVIKPTNKPSKSPEIKVIYSPKLPTPCNKKCSALTTGKPCIHDNPFDNTCFDLLFGRCPPFTTRCFENKIPETYIMEEPKIIDICLKGCNELTKGKPCIHDNPNDNTCFDFMKYGGCPPSTTKCFDIKDPCTICDIYKPCLNNDGYNGYSCTDTDIYGFCDNNSVLCEYNNKDICEINSCSKSKPCVSLIKPNICYDYMEYGGCPAGTKDCSGNTDPCLYCDYYKPCLEQTFGGYYNCYGKDKYGECFQGTKLCPYSEPKKYGEHVCNKICNEHTKDKPCMSLKYGDNTCFDYIKGNQCPAGTQACFIKHIKNPCEYCDIKHPCIYEFKGQYYCAGLNKYNKCDKGTSLCDYKPIYYSPKKDAPTIKPTKPTKMPTKSTEAPNVVEAPTSAPTDSPTPTPTNSPTLAPSNSPTPAPTNSPTSTPTVSPTRSTAAPSSLPTSSLTIFEFVCIRNDLTVLKDIIEILELQSIFSNETADLTLFAPTDVAIANIPGPIFMEISATVESLTSFLLYHVTTPDIQSSQLIDGQTLTMLNNQIITVSIQTPPIIQIIDSVNNRSTLVETDFAQLNGFVHIIDVALIPVL